MNFVLDIGNVLLNFKPGLFLRSLLNNREREEKMIEVIFNSPEWVKLDEGTITHEEACMVFCEREPAYKSDIEKVMENIVSMETPIPSTINLLPRIKSAGHGLFYLSNQHKKLCQYILAEYSFFDLFDGGVFSCDVNLVKPSAAIYALFLNKYRLLAKDCLFFDDMEQNVKTAESVGMKGVLFRDAKDIERYLRR